VWLSDCFTCDCLARSLVSESSGNATSASATAAAVAASVAAHGFGGGAESTGGAGGAGGEAGGFRAMLVSPKSTVITDHADDAGRIRIHKRTPGSRQVAGGDMVRIGGVDGVGGVDMVLKGGGGDGETGERREWNEMTR
jgi:hypothetical protein